MTEQQIQIQPVSQISGSRVFAVEKNPKFSMSAAAVFGKIIYLSKEDKMLNPFEPGRIIHVLENGLKSHRFSAVEDFILMTGNPLVLSYFTSVVISRYKKVNLLLFNARNSQYEPKEFFIP